MEPLLDVENETLQFGAGVSLDGRPLFLRRPTDIFALYLKQR
jgi:hypothetical protein